MAIAVGKDEGDPMVEPNVIPLVDIMLVLLIIMIITVPVMTHAVKIDLPKEVNRPTETKPENINLSIDFDGRHLLERQQRRQDAKLLNYVLAEAVKDPQPEVHIRADKRAHLRGSRGHALRAAAGRHAQSGFIAEPPHGRVAAAVTRQTRRRARRRRAFFLAGNG